MDSPEDQGGLSPIPNPDLNDQARSFYDFSSVQAGVGVSTICHKPQAKTKKSCRATGLVRPPSWDEVTRTCLEHEIFKQRTQELKSHGVSYSKKADADASSAITLGVDKVSIGWCLSLPAFKSKYGPLPEFDLSDGKRYILRRIQDPPSYDSVLDWCRDRDKIKTIPMDDRDSDEDSEANLNKTCVRIRQNSEDSLGSEVTMSPIHEEENPYGSMMITMQSDTSLEPHNHKGETTLRGVKEATDYYHLTLLAVEIFVQTRHVLLPDPEFDPVTCIFYAVYEEGPKKNSHGLLSLNSDMGCLDFDLVKIVQTEAEMFDVLVEVVQEHNPEILLGYDTQRSSWGYLCRRANGLGINLASKLSRLPKNSGDSRFAGPNGSSDIDAELHIAGRILLNVWRLMRSELTLTGYSFENVAFAVLKKRLAKFSHQDLTGMWSCSHKRWRVVEYHSKRVLGTLEMVEKLDLIGRTAELAKLFGIQFLEVLTRGSQFRVESIMLRLARARNFVPVSPTIQQRAKMRAPEYLPLVMEPESRMYNDPVIVLDFQSLYPSIIMAYNYCYSTCLGRVVDAMKNMPGEPYEFGCTQLKISPARLAKLQGHLNFSPGGIAFLKETVRKGILPKMLQEILDTRVMVKNSMKMHNKLHKDAAKLQKILHSRQLGLKLIANVTYGYTSANFSGRMPCIDVGDSVVSKGRETLERAIKTIESSPKWPGARVVYGDTDSLFVLLPGRSKAEAFDIGEEMAHTVTQDNPKPVKLKFEKVYSPCILQTKKRYVGYMYESRDQVKPVYDAKGIETVRRDGIPAVVKVSSPLLVRL